MNILEKICQLKHKEINLLKKKFKSSQQKLRTRGFFKSLLMKDNNNFSLIAEIKKSSPSKGLICKKFDPIQIRYYKQFKKLVIFTHPWDR